MNLHKVDKLKTPYEKSDFWINILLSQIQLVSKIIN